MSRIKIFDKATKTWVYADKSFGKDGKTPVKGVDYFTETDKAEMVSTVLEDIEPALDAIIAIQNKLIGGDGV